MARLPNYVFYNPLDQGKDVDAGPKVLQTMYNLEPNIDFFSDLAQATQRKGASLQVEQRQRAQDMQDAFAQAFERGEITPENATDKVAELYGRAGYAGDYANLANKEEERTRLRGRQEDQDYKSGMSAVRQWALTDPHVAADMAIRLGLDISTEELQQIYERSQKRGRGGTGTSLKNIKSQISILEAQREAASMVGDGEMVDQINRTIASLGRQAQRASEQIKYGTKKTGAKPIDEASSGALSRGTDSFLRGLGVIGDWLTSPGGSSAPPTGQGGPTVGRWRDMSPTIGPSPEPVTDSRNLYQAVNELLGGANPPERPLPQRRRGTPNIAF